MSTASRTAYSTWTPQKPTLFDGHYLRNRLTLDIGVLGYIGIVQHKEQSPEVLPIPPGTPSIARHIAGYVTRKLPTPFLQFVTVVPNGSFHYHCLNFVKYHTRVPILYASKQ